MTKENANTEAPTTEKVTKSVGRPKKALPPTSSETLLNSVESMLRIISEKKIRINHNEQTAGVDLGSRGRPNGTQFRQLFVKADAGFISVRLIEGFRASHGGSDNRKTLYSLVVPVSETKAYRLLQNRFFAYDMDQVVADCDNFLNILKETIRDSNSFG